MFSPLRVVSYIRDALQLVFSENGQHFKWDEDPDKSKIRIGTVNDHHNNDRSQKFPRVLIQRGAYTSNINFVSEGLNKSIGGGKPQGGSDIKRQDISGYLTLMIETGEEGTCEGLADYIRQFIMFSKPYVETKFGFQAFARQIQVSECMQDQEDVEKFKISINIPYTVEDGWKITGNDTRLNYIFQELNKG